MRLGCEIRVEYLDAVRADAVGEFRDRMLLAVGFELLPEPLVVADILAVATDGDQVSKFVDGLCGSPEFPVSLLEFNVLADCRFEG